MISLNSFEHYLPNLFYATTILVIGIVVAFLCRQILKRFLIFKNNDILKSFLLNLTFTSIVIITVIAVLGKLGVPTASLVALVGAGSLAIGLALRDFLANIAAGFMIILLKPFKVGDYITSNGAAGNIVDINLFVTQLRTATNEGLFIPNNKLITNPIINSSYYETRRIDLTIGVDYDTDLAKAKTLILEVINNHDLTFKQTPATVGVQELADNSINLLVRFWVKREDFLDGKLQVLEDIKNQLSKANINIPFPQLDINLKK